MVPLLTDVTARCASGHIALKLSFPDYGYNAPVVWGLAFEVKHVAMHLVGCKFANE